MDIVWIHLKAQGVFQLTEHAEEERLDENISIEDIQTALLSAEILEDYSDRKDARGKSCLVLGKDKMGKPLHLVVSCISADILRIVTVYIPRPPKWADAENRRKL